MSGYDDYKTRSDVDEHNRLACPVDSERLDYRAERCEAGSSCVHKKRPIVVGYDGAGRVATTSEDGLIFSPDGVRHRGCPDPRLCQSVDARFDEVMAFALGPRPE